MTIIRRAPHRAYVAREEFGIPGLSKGIPNPLDETKKLAEKVLAEAKAEAVKVKSDATRLATQTVNLAKNEALRIVEAAKAEALKIKDAAVKLGEGIGNRLKDVLGDIMSKLLGPLWDWILQAWSWFKWVLTVICCLCLCSSSWMCGCIPGLIALLGME